MFFLDYGNSEINKVTNLYPLPPKFQVYPFQMKLCCFCDNGELVYGREVCDVGGVCHNMFWVGDQLEQTMGNLEIILLYRQEYLLLIL